MVVFKAKLAGGSIDVERLNQCLKPNSEEEPPDTDNTNNRLTAPSMIGPFDDKSSVQRFHDNTASNMNT